MSLLVFYRAPATTGSKLWLRVAGVWKETTPYIRVAGVWKLATPFIKVSGTWK